jgi:hypothetical protein
MVSVDRVVLRLNEDTKESQLSFSSKKKPFFKGFSVGIML